MDPERDGAGGPGEPAPGFVPCGSGVPVWLLDVDGILNTSQPGWGAPHSVARPNARTRAPAAGWSSTGT